MPNLWWERFKTGLEWIEHTKLLVELIGSAAFGKTVQALLMTHTQISNVWITPLWLASSAVALYLLMLVSRKVSKKPKEQRQQTGEGAIVSQVPAAPTSQFKNVDDFYRTYDNVLLRECEDTIRAESNQYQPGADREKFLVRFSASSYITYFFEITWANIFGSQLLALDAINQAPRTIDEVRVYYDTIAAHRPDVFGHYSFDSWINFLRTRILIVEQGRIVHLSVRGKEFMKYLVHCGYSIHGRNL
jgi:hypothetical protein